MLERLDTQDVQVAAVLQDGAVAPFTEGPAVDADGSVYFSDIPNSRVMRLNADRELHVFREESGRTNGQTFGQDGWLYHCEGGEFGPGGNRRITRTNLRTAEYEVVTDSFEGCRYNSPNDICPDGAGRLYFTDSRYGKRDDLELDCEGVYRIDPDGATHLIISQPDIERPNGVAASVDGRLLYVVDTSLGVGGSRKIWRYGLDGRGNPTDRELFWDFAPGRGADGIRLDVAGNLYAAAGINSPRGPHESSDYPAGVYVFSADGRLLRRIVVPQDAVSNLAFGGADGRTIFITAGKTLFSTRNDVPGQVVFPPWAVAESDEQSRSAHRQATAM